MIAVSIPHPIRPATDNDLPAIIALSLAAWEPVFLSFREIFGPTLYARLYPDWRASQSAGVEGVCRDRERYTTLVAECEQQVVGFLAYEIHPESARGEIVLLAVHPAHQNAGIGTALNRRALEELQAAGVQIAIVETGGDPSHAAARRTYEKAGYTAMPITRYFKAL